MSSNVRFRPLARLELGEAVAWYEARRPGLGLELKAEVDVVLVRAARARGAFGGFEARSGGPSFAAIPGTSRGADDRVGPQSGPAWGAAVRGRDAGGIGCLTAAMRILFDQGTPVPLRRFFPGESQELDGEP